ncbi:MAG: hypothetical protein AAGC68_13275, partial [Verrucomicrobiota bacterium]
GKSEIVGNTEPMLKILQSLARIDNANHQLRRLSFGAAKEFRKLDPNETEAVPLLLEIKESKKEKQQEQGNAAPPC